VAGSGEIYRRKDGKWAWRIRASNGQTVATDGGQGYNAKAAARRTLQKVITGGYDGPITEVEE
jgi:uncharacterized protein YegP (UPF0339 family)